MGCGYAVCVVLALIGVALLAAGDSKLHQGRTTDAWILAGLGVSFCLVAVGLVMPMRREVARAQERRRLEEARPDEPWTWNPAWTSESGIPQSGSRHGRAFLVFGILSLVCSIPALLA